MARQFHIVCTGGCGYIGSHCVLKLLENGYDVTILDNISNSSTEVLVALEEITQRKIKFVQLDLTDRAGVITFFFSQKFDAVVHFAAFKDLGESVADPLKYYWNNVTGALNLFEAMKLTQCKNLILSSSATVYRPQKRLIVEEDELGPSNPYGQTKLITEQMLRDLHVSDGTWKISILRYFNPVGAHSSGKIGENSRSSNLLSRVLEVAIGRQPFVPIYGNDWDTHDGTGVRDYIHIEDLAEGHIAALNAQMHMLCGRCQTYNLGTGAGVSVLGLIQCFEKTTGKRIPYKFVDRRPGDLSSVVADPSKANKELNWEATRTISSACISAWNWCTQSNNSRGV